MQSRLAGNSPLVRSVCLALCFTAPLTIHAETRKETAASYVALGDKFSHDKQFERAIAAYNIAVQFAPDFGAAYFKRGLAQQARGDFAAAIADYSKTVEVVPECAEAYANRAYLLALQHKTEKAFA